MRKIFKSSVPVIGLFIFFLGHSAFSQQKGQAIEASIGFGISASVYENDEVVGSGFYAQGEYIFAPTTWFALRPYAGVIFTSPDKVSTPEEYSNYRATSKAFLIGGKLRICAPIPYVAPFFEIGAGMSLGSFITDVPATYIEKKGLVPHMPFSFGLALGKKHNFELEFTSYYHQSLDQVSGALAFGYKFPLN